MDPGPPKEGEKEDYWKFAHSGLELAGALLLGLWLGYKLDGRLGTMPWLTLAGALLGLAAGFFLVGRELLGGGPPPGKGK